MSFLSFAMNFVLLPPEMMAPQHIHIDDYAYPLPDDRIARYPLPQRDRSKLLVYRGGQIGETVFNRLPDELPSDALLVFNNTRVIRARLLFHKTTGAQIELFCLEPAEPADYAQIFQQTEQCSWHCLIGNLKKWKDGTLTRTVYLGEESVRLTAEREETHGTSHLVTFRWDDSRYTFAEVLEAAGILPIPPYLRRETEPTDLQTYQTVYSRIKGSVAAPTAGLHFTPEVLAELDARGCQEPNDRIARNAHGAFRRQSPDNRTPHNRVRACNCCRYYVGTHTRKPLLPRRPTLNDRADRPRQPSDR